MSTIVIPGHVQSRVVTYGAISAVPGQVGPLTDSGMLPVRTVGFDAHLSAEQWAVLLPAIFAELPVNLRAEVLAAIHRGARA